MVVVPGERVELEEEVGLEGRNHADRHVAADAEHQRTQQQDPPFIDVALRLKAGQEDDDCAGGQLEDSDKGVEGSEGVEEAGVSSDLDGIVGPIAGEAVLKPEVLRCLAN